MIVTKLYVVYCKKVLRRATNAFDCMNVTTGWCKKNACFSNNCNFVYFQYRKIVSTPKQPVINAVLITSLITQLWKIISVRWRPSYRTHVRSLSSKFCITFICLRFLSLGLPQIKSLRSKTSYSQRSESFHSRRNCNCATRNVSKCDAEL